MIPAIKIKRRNFLKFALMGSAAFTVGAYGYLSLSYNKHDRFKNLQILSLTESEILLAIANRVIPDDKKFPTAYEAQVVERLDEELFFVHQSISSDYKLALSVLEYAPLFLGYFSRFTKLSGEKKLAFLKDSQVTKSDTLRSVTNAIRMSISLVYYGHEATWKNIDYDGSFSKMQPLNSVQRVYYKKLTTP